MNKRQRIKHRRLGITKLVMKLLKEIDEIQESKSERRIRPLMHKRWVHKRFYVRRKLSKTEQLVIEFLMRAAHRRFSPAAFYNRTICLEQFVLFGMQQGKSYINCVTTSSFHRSSNKYTIRQLRLVIAGCFVEIVSSDKNVCIAKPR